MKTNKKDSIEDQAEEIKSGVSNVIESAREKAGEYYETARERVRDWSDDGVDYVRENPMKTLLAALVVGVAIGFAVRK